MKIGEKVRHRARADVGIGELVEIYSDGTCQALFPGGCFSGVPLEMLISVEEEFRIAAIAMQLEQERQAAEQLAIQLDLARKARRHEVEALLDKGDVSGAEKLYRDHCGDWWPKSDFDKLKIVSDYIRNFVEKYKTGSLADLDLFFINRPLETDLSVDEYVELKMPRVRGSISRLGIRLDGEQECANCRPESRLLIRARAGSGKTRTLCARAALAICDENLDPNQVLTLAFNKAAAVEVKHRIQKIGGISNYTNARTFHSLAHQLVKPKKNLLFDEGGNPSAREQGRFVQRLMQRIMNPAFRESMVDFFRKELEQIEDIGRNLQPEDYFAFRRALSLVSLRGDPVKSNGEKYIADFLFEHGIEYRYERAWEWKSDFLGGATYRPDFSIVSNGKDYILEHWGINPDDRSAEVPRHWSTSTAEYRRQVQAKREFWASKEAILIETHVGLMCLGRDSFEDRLRDILTRQGIECRRLSREEIVGRVFDNDFSISRMADLFLQFIQRAKRRGWSPDGVSQVLASSPDPEPRNRLFHDLALRAYREYESMLIESDSMDFDDLLVRAAEEVRDKRGDASIHLGEGRHIPISQLRWILVDEYQDFSELYSKMLDAILQSNPSIRLVAVGDDWQAINAFAGAELGFFENFQGNFSGAEIVDVSTNYRSERPIVDAGNRLMAGRGKLAVAGKSGLDCKGGLGRIDVHRIDDVWIELRSGGNFNVARQQDELYLSPQVDGKRSPSALRQAQALKLCASIIVDSPSIKTMLLARTGMAYGLTLAEFRSRLIRSLSALTSIPEESLGKQIVAMTAHGSKGQEAERVIILDATDGQFPKMHPDNLLFSPFGMTVEHVLDEERRLFYVAVTRAERFLHVITEAEKESRYLRALAGSSSSYSADVSVGRRGLGVVARKIRDFLDSPEAINTSSLMPTSSTAGPWEIVRTNVSPRFQDLVVALRQANVPLPETEYSLPGDEDGASAELAWPENSPPVAILSANQCEFIDRWKAFGWRVAGYELTDDRIVVGVCHYLKGKA